MEKIINQLKNKNLVILKKDELEEIIFQCEVVKEEDTFLSGKIRILKFETVIIIQEENTKDEIILRLFKSIADAEEFINKRLQTYNNMWDGCGCKVNYYEV